MRKRWNRSAFTLVELLVVIAIIGILVALLLPAVQAAREAARRSQCTNNLKQMGIGLHNHHDTLKTLPPGVMRPTGPENSENGSHWTAYLLPFIEQTPLYDKIAPLENPVPVWADGGVRQAACSTLIPAFRCPSSADPDTLNSQGIASRVLSNYGAVASGTSGLPGHAQAGENGFYLDDGGPDHARFNGVFTFNKKRKLSDITDGTSNTAGVAEWFRYENTADGNSNNTICDHFILGSPDINNLHTHAYGSLGHPINRRDDQHAGRAAFRSRHPGGANLMLMDGSVRFLNENVADVVRGAMGTRNGGEVVNDS
jgi:prepilin-type N-terminal cleavage/methylation domain-containing protein/prepilin-type processing-associated H-X9-DG protein